VTSDPRYALISHSTINLGDEIQSIAVRQFLPRVDLLVDRDALNRLPEGASGRYKIVLNGWHTRRPENWPPAPEFDALTVSVHLSGEVNPANPTGRRPAEALLEGENLDYWRAHAPVGTRDLWTLDLLRAKGVDAYFSACATLTLGTGTTLPRHDYICAVDLPEPVLDALKQRARCRVVVTTHRDPAPAPFAQRMRRAERLLSLYAQARAVVTSRLHCALPCLAFQTPVLLIDAARDVYRFSGLHDLVAHCAPQDFLNRAAAFDPNEPPPNTDAYLAYRQALARAVNAFIDPANQSDGAPHPFVPDTDVDDLIGVEEALTEKENAATRARGIFRQAFKPGTDFSRYKPADFLRDLAKVHRQMGDTREARRLLEIALAERPNGAGIKQLLDDLDRDA
jgi:hypothetical protein